MSVVVIVEDVLNALNLVHLMLLLWKIKRQLSESHVQAVEHV